MMSSRRNRDRLLLFTLKCILGNEASGGGGEVSGGSRRTSTGTHQSPAGTGSRRPQLVGQLVQNHKN